jgi:hypothetical protein
MNKGQSQALHSRKRCLERCGIRLDEENYSYILKAIHGEEVKGLTVNFKVKQSARVEHYTVKFQHKEEPFNIVYDRDRDAIITFLPHGNETIFYHYTNWIGNVINIKDQHGVILVLKDGVMKGNHLDITQLEEKIWHIEDFNKTLQLRGDRLFEI